MDTSGEHALEIRFEINGTPRQVRVSPETTLLQLVRDHLHLTGTKCGCEIGQCGACTVLLDGRAVASCLVLAGQVEGRRVLTVEGLGPELHPLQVAFLDHDAVACGFCTPGMILSAKALLDRQPHPTRAEIRRALSGNLCRCTGYLPIIDAVEAVAAGRYDTPGLARGEAGAGAGAPEKPQTPDPGETP